MSATLRLLVHGHPYGVSRAALQAELRRQGPPPRLPLLEAVIRYAPRQQAIARLSNMLAAPVPPGGEHLVLHAVLGLLWLMPQEPSAHQALRDHATRLGGAAGASIEAGVILLSEGPDALAMRADPLLLRQSPRAVCALSQPGALPPGLRTLVSAWMNALARAWRTQGAQAFRAHLGDVAEAIYRVVQRSAPPCCLHDLVSDEHQAQLLDLLAAELPGTADFLAARAMVWLIGLYGPPDDASAAAIERARDRFANEAFHADCALILSGGPWPPPAQRG